VKQCAWLCAALGALCLLLMLLTQVLTPQQASKQALSWLAAAMTMGSAAALC